jgi:hypothetical protein
MRSMAECEYRLMLLARDRNREGRATYVLEHEVVLCEDYRTCMVYLSFGLPGDDPRQIDVSDIDAIYYDLDAPISETNFDAAGAARFRGPCAIDE